MREITGVVLCGVKRFNDNSPVDESIDLVVSGKRVYYDTSLWGGITPHQLDLLQPRVTQNRVAGTLKSKWGKGWVERTNAELADKGDENCLVEYTENGLR